MSMAHTCQNDFCQRVQIVVVCLRSSNHLTPIEGGSSQIIEKFEINAGYQFAACNRSFVNAFPPIPPFNL